MSILEVKNLEKHFDKTKVLNDISFSLEEGQALSIIGSSGSGKTTLLRCLNFLETPDAGSIAVKGETLFDAADPATRREADVRRKRLHFGLVFQSFNLFPQYTALGNVTLASKLLAKERPDYKQNKKAIFEAIDKEGLELLASMGLSDRTEHYPHQLSGGQQQRVALARILVNRPEVLLLDEPFSALDSHLRFQLEQELRGAIRRFGKTVLLVSHNRDEVFRLSDEVAIMHDGRIETTGEKKAVFANPRTRNGAILTGCKNVSPVEATGERRARAVDWGVELALPASADGVQYVGIRMHDVRLADAQGEPNAFLCRVEETIENPFSCTVLLRPEGAASPIGWELDKERWRQIRAERLRVCLPPESMLLLKE